MTIDLLISCTTLIKALLNHNQLKEDNYCISNNAICKTRHYAKTNDKLSEVTENSYQKPDKNLGIAN